MNIDSDISRHEVWRRIVMVLDRHPDYTGKIVISFQGKSTSFWDTGSFRQKNPCREAGLASHDVTEY